MFDSTIEHENSASHSRGVRVLGSKLRELRRSRGWTQKELARRSGYCSRLVRKAELDGSVSVGTLEDLAVTLSQTGSVVSISDLIYEDSNCIEAFVADLLDTHEQKNSNVFNTFLQPEILVDCSLATHGLPIRGRSSNHTDAISLLEKLRDFLTHVRSRVTQKVVLRSGLHGFAHITVEYRPPRRRKVQLYFDLRFELQNSKISKIYLLSPLAELLPFRSQIWPKK
jgi:transcriptional regulator with XRE-family HTH domain